MLLRCTLHVHKAYCMENQLSLFGNFVLVNVVIRTVIKNLAGKCVDRLPSIGTISKLALEANHLASIEVALAMKSATHKRQLETVSMGTGLQSTTENTKIFR